MMSSSRGEPMEMQLGASADDLLTLLRMMRDPAAVEALLTKVKDESGKVKAGRTALTAAQETALKEHHARVAEINQREADLSKHHDEVEAGWREVQAKMQEADAHHLLATARLTEAQETVAKLAVERESLTAAQTDLTRKYNDWQEQRAISQAELVTHKEAVVAAIASTRQKAAAEHLAREKELAAREMTLQQREATIADTHKAAEALRADYEGRLAKLHQLATGA